MDNQTNPEIRYDILCNQSMMMRFIIAYSGTKCNPIDLTAEDYSSTFHDILERVVRSGEWRNDKSALKYNDKTYKIGSKLSIAYYPNSQKYIDYYNDLQYNGILIFADNETDNAIFIVIKEPMQISDNSSYIIIKSLERESSHYFGISRDYSYFINPI
jgi:hypothetical protein